MKRTIGIMGNISAGKTTLCKLIEKRWDYVFYPEEVDELLTDDGKYVNWMFIEQGSATLYWCMLMEAHPGADTCFDIIVGDWDAEFNKWIFTCADTPDIGVDFHYDAPLPEIYACGWFEKHPSDTTDSGWIYHVVSLDCTSRGACADLTATGCGEA